MNYKDYFKDKNIAIIGLGPHGEMVADIKLILRLGAKVSFYDVRSEARIAKFLRPLMAFGLEDIILGKVPKDELVEKDLIILSPEISRKALFLKKAIEVGVKIEFPNILFLKLAPSITLIGVMGACGKSTVAQMIYGMLKRSFVEYPDQGLFFIDQDLSNGALTHLKKIKAGDVVLARIPEEMMGEYSNARINPHVAVITSLTSSALQEVKNAFGILEYQTYNNFIVAPNEVVDAIKKQVHFVPKAKILRTKSENSALVIQTAELFKVSKEIIDRVIEDFGGLKNHQELIKKISGIEFYNDSASITPFATLYALKRLSINKNIVLILGGAYTSYDYGDLVKEIPEYASTVILVPGSATLGFRSDIENLKDITYKQAIDLEDAVKIAHEYAKKGDRVLFSPGCEAIGIDASRRERGERFVRAVRGL